LDKWYDGRNSSGAVVDVKLQTVTSTTTGARELAVTFPEQLRDC
jgi:hypothetical protein